MQNNLPAPSRCWVHIGNVSPASNRFLCQWYVMLLLFPIRFVRIVRIHFSCSRSQADNCCPTTFFSNLQHPLLLFIVNGYCVDIILRLNYFIILRFEFVVFTLVLVIIFTVILMPFYCVFLIIYWREIFYECICFLFCEKVTFFRWHWSLHNTVHWRKKKMSGIKCFMMSFFWI